MRRFIRRLGRWLVDWADGGARIHLCRPPPREFGVSYDQAPASYEFASIAYRAVELKRGQTCPNCGEANS